MQIDCFRGSESLQDGRGGSVASPVAHLRQIPERPQDHGEVLQGGSFHVALRKPADQGTARCHRDANHAALHAAQALVLPVSGQHPGG